MEKDYQARIGSLLPQTDLSKYQPVYLEKDSKRAKEWRFTPDHTLPDWKCSTQGIVLIAEVVSDPVLQHIHNSTQYRIDAALQWIQKHVTGPNQ